MTQKPMPALRGPVFQRTQPPKPVGATGNPASSLKMVDRNSPEADQMSPIRQAGFFLALIFLFIRLTALHELIADRLGFNTYVLYLFGPPAILCMLLSGGLQRSFRWLPAYLWLGFLLFLYLSVPLSIWRGGSFKLVTTYTRTEFILLPLIAGLGATWTDLRKLMRVMSLGGMVSVLIGIFFTSAIVGGRNELAFGTMSNANDFAAHLIFVLPFVILAVMTWKSILLRVAAVLMILAGLYRILSTGSRGALVALLVTLVFVFLRFSLKKKLVMMIAASIVFLAMIALLPGAVSARLLSLFKSDEEQILVDEGAYASRQSRTHLLKRSLYLTITHPLLGVGPGEFANAENEDSQAQFDQRGAWHDTHNAYTQVSSETGIPAGLCFIAAVITTFTLVNRIYKEARKRSESPIQRPVMLTSFCILVSIIGFMAACFFLSLAYTFYFPLLSGIAIVLAQSVQLEWAKEDRVKAAQPA